MILPGHDLTGALTRTRSLPNCVTAVEVLGAGEAIRCRLHDRRTFDLAAADIRPGPGQDARHAVEEAVYRACLERQRVPA